MRILLTPYEYAYGGTRNVQSSLHDNDEIRKFAVSADINTTMQLAYILIERGVPLEDIKQELEYRKFDPEI